MISATQKAKIRPVHPFPARMAPSIVWDALPNKGGCFSVLDPMSGSGTTLVCARSRGHRAIGCDTDPLALLIARTWCRDINPENVKLRAEIVLKRSKRLKEQLSSEESYPKRADAETRKFIDFWFDAENRCELTALTTCISRVHSQTERDILWCAMSRMIVTKKYGVSLAMDVSHSRPHKVCDVAPVKPFDIFLKSVSTVADRSPFADNTSNVLPADIKYGDARNLPIESASIDMVITSPPYLNAIDYLRGHKLSLVWLGHSISKLRSLRSSNIGSESSVQSTSDETVREAIKAMVDYESLNPIHQGMVRRYVIDMQNVMKECARVLNVNGRALFVIGDSTIRGIFVKNSEALICLAARNGLSLVSRDTRPIEANRRYLPPPESKRSGDKMQGRMKEEVILEFRRSCG